MIPMKSALTNLGIAITASLIMLSIGELVVRAIYANQIVLFPRYHTDAQYGEFTLRRMRPNSEFVHRSVDGSWRFTINNNGLRNFTDYPYEKPPGTLRILSIGDSNTLGFEVRQEYTFSSIIGRHLSRDGSKVEVINAGVSGFSTAEEVVYLENEGIKYKPDIVVLGFFKNDIEDNIKAGIFSLNDERLITEKKVHIPGVKIQDLIYSVPGVKWLSEHSYFYSLLFNKTWDFFKNRLAKSTAENLTEYAIARQMKYSDYQLELASSLLERMYRFCERNNIKLIIIDIPTANEDRTIGSSFPTNLADSARKYSHLYIDSPALLSEHSGVSELHVPNGQRHISELTHSIIGVETAKSIATLISKREN